MVGVIRAWPLGTDLSEAAAAVAVACSSSEASRFNVRGAPSTRGDDLLCCDLLTGLPHYTTARTQMNGSLRTFTSAGCLLRLKCVTVGNPAGPLCRTNEITRRATCYFTQEKASLVGGPHC